MKMCGIAGFIWKEQHRPAAGELVRAMADSIAHRGPDDEGFFTSGPVALGHRRLAILDLSTAGHQPKTSHDGRYTIVYNGEIYNYIELRDELRPLGGRFVSESDTEVILEAYRIWGPDCVQRFNGMWAFAIHDRDAGKLFFSRDRFGIKPLYYVDRTDCLVFASEIKACLVALPEERQVHLPMVHYFLSSGMLCDGPETFFRDVKAFPPAHCGTYDMQRGELRLGRYWEVHPERQLADLRAEEAVESLSNLINSAVSLHTRSDVSVGTCLSGGVDSSTIVAAMSRGCTGRVHTFSGLYSEPDCDESLYVDLVNRHTGCLPFSVRPCPRGDLLDDLATIVWHQDMPSAGPGLYTQFHVMRRASQEITVLLDGQGGDELFAGYLPYFALRLQDLCHSGIPQRFRAVKMATEIAWHYGLRTVAPALPHLCGRYPAALASRLHRAIRPAPSSASVLHPSLVSAVGNDAIVRHWPRGFSTRLNDTLHRQLIAESIPALLHYEDRNSMAFSIEARVPLLDYRIVEFAFSLPPQLKIHGSWTKWVLRSAAARMLPDAVAWRRSKLGYPTPFAQWLRTGSDGADLRDLIFSREFARRELVQMDRLEALWRQHQAGQADHSWLLWRCATLELWYRAFIDGWSPHGVTLRSARTPTTA